MPESITVQAWIDSGAAEPEATTVTLARSEHTALYELSVDMSHAQLVGGILIDLDSLHALLDWTTEMDQ